MGGSNFFLRQKNTNLIEGDHTRLANRNVDGQHPLGSIYRVSDNKSLQNILEPLIFHQDTPTTDVTITHNRNVLYPRVLLTLEDGTPFETEVNYLDNNIINIKTNDAISFYVIIY